MCEVQLCTVCVLHVLRVLNVWHVRCFLCCTWGCWVCDMCCRCLSGRYYVLRVYMFYGRTCCVSVVLFATYLTYVCLCALGIVHVLCLCVSTFMYMLWALCVWYVYVWNVWYVMSCVFHVLCVSVGYMLYGSCVCVLCALVCCVYVLRVSCMCCIWALCVCGAHVCICDACVTVSFFFGRVMWHEES